MRLEQVQALAELSTLASYVSDAMSQTRFLLALIGAFAVLALGLASLGLYGVISYSAKQRTRELGVRVALGASERDVVRLILGQGLAVSLELSKQIEGLFHAGSVGIIMSGWLGSANYGVIQANKIDALLVGRRQAAGAAR